MKSPQSRNNVIFGSEAFGRLCELQEQVALSIWRPREVARARAKTVCMIRADCSRTFSGDDSGAPRELEAAGLLLVVIIRYA